MIRFRYLYVAAFAVSLSASALSAQTQEERLQALLKKFPAADANKDGVLTREEAVKYRDTVLKKQRAKGKPERPKPTHADVKYGEHERNVFDLWLPENNDKPPKDGYPLFVYFHGGGFVAGDKSGFDPTAYLEKGLAVVSANYRFVDGDKTLSPAPLLDSARVIQFLRHHANKWNLNKHRIAVSGSSAGAVIAMWIGYHDDLANGASKDPVEYHSSRVQCIIPLNGPTNLDPHWITKNMGGPKHVHGSFPKMFGEPISDNMSSEAMQRIKESSPIEHVTKDDPPTLMIYGGKLEGIPLPESASTGLLIHHPHFGKVLKEKLDELKIPNGFYHGSDPRRGSGQQLILKWLDDYLIDKIASVPAPKKIWPTGLKNLLGTLKKEGLRPPDDEVQVVYARPGKYGTYDYADGLYWRMPASEEAIREHVKELKLNQYDRTEREKEARIKEVSIKKFFDRYPEDWPKLHREQLTWYTWFGNRDDTGISAHFWKTMVRDKSRDELFVFYWIWDVGI